MDGYRTMLVAVDFSDCSQELIDHAVRLASPAPRIVVLHVAELPHGLASTATCEAGAERTTTAQNLLVETSRARLKEYQLVASNAGYPLQFDVASGNTAETIVDRARRYQAELIVMGTHGRHGLSRIVGGSVAAEVIAIADCPVLIVRSAHKPTCRARSCDVCSSHLTSELEQLKVERDG